VFDRISGVPPGQAVNCVIGVTRSATSDIGHI
jgi:hypothetical protein